MATAPARKPHLVTEVSPAIRTLRMEAAGLRALEAALEGDMHEPFGRACETIAAAAGRVIVTGMGKSGHIGAKIAATLASTGTPAFFVHPAEASHGDLGMITPQDVVLALSWSGETAELRNIVFYSRRFRVPFIAITSRPNSTLGRSADIALILPRVDEACPHGLAPTTSTLIQLALGDALAIALLEEHGFTADDFYKFHPGGSLGANLTHIRDVMHAGERVPLAPVGTLMKEALLLISQKGFGCLGVTDTNGALVGIITDGDLRRHLTGDILVRPVEEVMTASPKTIEPDALVASALEILNSAAITALFVVERKKPVGIVHMHDLLRIGAA
jgi:arabinose-5-phosphate isomerase